MHTDGRLIVITGVMASGKSTVAQGVANRFSPSTHIHGDVFRRFVVRGAADPRPPVGAEFLHQLRTRYRAAVRAAEAYVEAGFTAVLQDVVVGPVLQDLVAAVTVRDAYLVVLDPDASVVAARERARAKIGYHEGWDPGAFVTELRTNTPRVGLWLDTSERTADETVRTIVDRLDDACLPGRHDESRA